MTDKELTKKAISICRKACSDLEKLVKDQKVPVYLNLYGMRRWYKHNDNSCLVINGKDLLYRIIAGQVKNNANDMLVQATTAAVKKLKNKIIKDIVDDCRRNISRASGEIVKYETTIRELVKSGKITEKKLHRLLIRNKI